MKIAEEEKFALSVFHNGSTAFHVLFAYVFNIYLVCYFLVLILFCLFVVSASNCIPFYIWRKSLKKRTWLHYNFRFSKGNCPGKFPFSCHLQPVAQDSFVSLLSILGFVYIKKIEFNVEFIFCMYFQIYIKIICSKLNAWGFT